MNLYAYSFIVTATILVSIINYFAVKAVFSPLSGFLRYSLSMLPLFFAAFAFYYHQGAQVKYGTLLLVDVVLGLLIGFVVQSVFLKQAIELKQIFGVVFLLSGLFVLK